MFRLIGSGASCRVFLICIFQLDRWCVLGVEQQALPERATNLVEIRSTKATHLYKIEFKDRRR